MMDWATGRPLSLPAPSPRAKGTGRKERHLHQRPPHPPHPPCPAAAQKRNWPEVAHICSTGAMLEGWKVTLSAPRPQLLVAVASVIWKMPVAMERVPWPEARLLSASRNEGVLPRGGRPRTCRRTLRMRETRSMITRPLASVMELPPPLRLPPQMVLDLPTEKAPKTRRRIPRERRCRRESPAIVDGRKYPSIPRWCLGLRRT